MSKLQDFEIPHRFELPEFEIPQRFKLAARHVHKLLFQIFEIPQRVLGSRGYNLRQTSTYHHVTSSGIRPAATGLRRLACG
jgi:hypothetical protein